MSVGIRASTDATPAEFRPIHDWWAAHVCGTQLTTEPPFTRAYFDAIEAERYAREPFIFSFAQFTRHRGHRVLEIGVGAGSDFVQWVRAGAVATGIDLTEEGIAHCRRRLELEGLRAEELVVGNAEALQFEDGAFDLVYSWGVIHHSVSTIHALREIVRVTKRGGQCKVMLYHRRSLCALYTWVKWGLLRARPFRSVATCLANWVESPGTKAFTIGEARAMLRDVGVSNADIRCVLTYQDRLEDHLGVRWLGRLLARLAGPGAGWYMLIEFRAP